MLCAAGHTITAAADGEKALSIAAASTEPIDLLITDVVDAQGERS
jgi:hypothetical protein